MRINLLINISRVEKPGDCHTGSVRTAISKDFTSVADISVLGIPVSKCSDYLEIILRASEGRYSVKTDIQPILYMEIMKVFLILISTYHTKKSVIVENKLTKIA